jgi:hypothetical protein
MRELTPDTKIKLSQIKRLITDKHSKDQVGTVRRWSDNKLHEKTSHGWKVVANNKEYDVRLNKTEEKKNKKTVVPISPCTEKEFNDFIESLYVNPHMRTPKAIRLPDLNRKLKKQIGLDKNVMIIFNSKYFHISPERKGSEKQALRKEEYKKIPSIIKNARQAILEKGTGDFKLLFDDEQNPHKINKIIFSKTNKGNYILNVSKVDKYNGYDRKNSKVVGEGVAPSI